MVRTFLRCFGREQNTVLHGKRSLFRQWLRKQGSIRDVQSYALTVIHGHYYVHRWRVRGHSLRIFRWLGLYALLPPESPCRRLCNTSSALFH